MASDDYAMIRRARASGQPGLYCCVLPEATFDAAATRIDVGHGFMRRIRAFRRLPRRRFGTMLAAAGISAAHSRRFMTPSQTGLTDTSSTAACQLAHRRACGQRSPTKFHRKAIIGMLG